MVGSHLSNGIPGEKVPSALDLGRRNTLASTSMSDTTPHGPTANVGERMAFLFLRQAPFLPSATDLGLNTCPVSPWPHQLRVVREVTRRFPESFLFCDEVGLGKTIEAGLALRQLVISGRVRRALLLVPRGLLRQWQEELHEKLVLPVLRYEGGRFFDVHQREVPTPAGANPWNAHDLVLASSQLARRRTRRDELLAAEPWDLVILDEAHHARRRGLGTASTQPNRLLELLAGTSHHRGLKERTRCLYLLTATPMQIHPLEVWDLLRLLGLGGLWGAREETFLGYFEELRRPFAERNWPRLFELLAESLELSEGFDPVFMDQLRERLETAQWQSLQNFLGRALSTGDGSDERPRSSDELPQGEVRSALDSLFHHHTPLLTFAWRNTRELLRRYQRRGLLAVGVPTRRPHNVWIEFSPSERTLYERIDAYLTESYQRYEARRRGLGFVMTVYRRRLTSSFFAIRQSLERRLAWLSTVDSEQHTALSEEDLAFEEIASEEIASEEIPAGAPTPERRCGGNEREAPSLFVDPRADEKAWLEDFLGDLARLRGDSKRSRLRRDLRRLLKKRPSALIFTQYTDTLDHLRDVLRQDHENRVACYSGRGGEVWNGTSWEPCGKEQLKEKFRQGDVRILLATEAAGEGLNLQTCGVLINYDMPWNPMRVEQRIGRIDRIGQEFDEVWIYNYFYSDSVEAEIYRRLADRIGWFEEVVGRLQPILHGVGESIRQVAMTPAARRARDLDKEVGRLAQQLQEQNPDAWLDLDRDLDAQAITQEATPPPVDWRQIESLILASPTLGHLFAADPELPHAHRLTQGTTTRRVTFSPEVFDQHPYSLELLTYGNPLFRQLLERVEAPEQSDDPTGVGLYQSQHPAPVSLFLLPTAEPITQLTTLVATVEKGVGPWRGAEEGAASTTFSRQRQGVLRRMSRVIERRRRARRRALVQTARRILVHTALVELARDRTPTLFDEPLPHGFGGEAVTALSRHGAPFAELLEAVAGEELIARADDPFYLTVEGRSPAHLENRWTTLHARGNDLVDALRQLEADLAEARHNLREPSSGGLLERRWFPLGDAALHGGETFTPLPELNPTKVLPFKNAVPLYSDLVEVAHRFADPEEQTQHDEETHPDSHIWVALEGRIRPAPGLFVAPADGGWCLFRLLHHRAHRGSTPRDGALVLASHHALDDPELGRGFGLRVFEQEERPSEDHAWPIRRIILGAPSSEGEMVPLVLEDDEKGDLWLIAELVEILK